MNNGVKITNSSSPILVAKNITLTVVKCCRPPPLRLVAHGVAAAAPITTEVVSPNPYTVGMVIHLFSEIYDEY